MTFQYNSSSKNENDQTEYNFTVTSEFIYIDILIVGGGGCGGNYGGGGGGAGGLLLLENTKINNGTYQINVGNGSIANSTLYTDNNGKTSSFSNYIALGGGGGASKDDYTYAGSLVIDESVGSGGGGVSSINRKLSKGGYGTFMQGNNGGNGENILNGNSGGGGGANSIGQDGITGGNGGIGINLSNLFNENVGDLGWFAGGGGGCLYIDQSNITDSKGGKGGGGDAALTNDTVGTNGLLHTGGGGGGGSGNALGGNGGSGVVIIKEHLSTIEIPLFKYFLTYNRPISKYFI